jgi:hypothetical protein
MNARKILLLVASHIAVAAAGFAGGIYVLPILIAPAAPTLGEIKAATTQVQFTGQFKRGLKDSDSLHWGEGIVSIAPNAISLAGKLAPGPDYKLYLSPEFVETEADFNRLKTSMVRVAGFRAGVEQGLALAIGEPPDTGRGDRRDGDLGDRIGADPTELALRVVQARR